MSLGTGLGATSTMFTIVNALLLRDLAVAEPQQLVEIGRVTQRGPGFSFSYPAYQRLRDDNRAFSGLIALSRETIEGSTGDGSAAAAGRFVSGNFFETLGIVPQAGRLFSPRDDRLEAPAEAAVAVVAHRFWNRQLGASHSALGQTLRVDATRFTIIGVLPPSFDGVVVGRAADVLSQVRATPGVQQASLSRVTPVSGGGMERPIVVEGRAIDAADVVSANRISENFFATLRTPLILGRDFVGADLTGVQPVAIVNAALVRRYFPNETPIGRRIVLGDRQPREIVGVVGNAKYYSLRDRDTPIAYSPLQQVERGELTLAVRTSGQPPAFADTLRRRVIAVEPMVPISRVRTLTSQLERSLSTERLIARLLSTFAILSLALAAVGLYGVLGYAVARRTSEIGVRLALGATRAGVMRAVLRQAVTMVLAGSAIGVPAALLLSQTLGGVLYGVTPMEPTVLASSVFVLLAVATAAAAVPAYRAARVDPLVALRHE